MSIGLRPSKSFRRPPFPPLNANKFNAAPWRQRLLIGTPMTGNLRAEWVSARYNQVIPTNWSQVEYAPFLYSHIPLRYQVADAENLIAKICVEGQYEWLLFIEHDNVLSPGTFIRLNDYMIDGKIPIVGGLYFTKSVPPEPLVYKRLGWGHFKDWKFGDKIWCRGIPFGCTLIHGSIIKALWEESPEYVVGNVTTRRVFEAPHQQWWDVQQGVWKATAGTSDLQFCERVISHGIFAKAGWPKFQKMSTPFLIDTDIFCRHIDEHGRQYPLEIPKRYLRSEEEMKALRESQAKESQADLIAKGAGNGK